MRLLHLFHFAWIKYCVYMDVYIFFLLIIWTCTLIQSYKSYRVHFSLVAVSRVISNTVVPNHKFNVNAKMRIVIVII